MNSDQTTHLDRRRTEIDCAGCTASVEIAGIGPDVVFVGSAVPMAWPRPAADAIANRGFRVTNFDYGPPPGWEAEPVPRTCLEQVDDVILVMDGAGMARAHVIGLSRGAITAFGLASRFPERVNKLVLAFPVAGFADTIGIGVETASGGEGESLEPLAMLDRALETSFSAEFLATNRQECRDLFLSPPGTVVRVERLEEETLGPDETVVAPTLIVSGGGDLVVAREHPARLKVAIPGAETFEFSGAMHGFVMEQPDSFANVVVPFLNR